jgi:hypothetical protein
MSKTTKLALPLHGSNSPEGSHPVGLNHDGAMAILDNAAVLVAVPASATAPGTVGQIATDGLFLYACVASNQWKRAMLASW